MAEQKENPEQKPKGEWVHPWEQQKQGWGWRMWLWPIGLLGPLIGSIISTIILIAILWGLKFVNTILQSVFITQIIGAVDANIIWFFVFFLFTSYAKFLMMRSRTAYYLFHPLSEAVSATFLAWIMGWLLGYSGSALGVPLISQVGQLLSGNLVWVFIIVLALSYIGLAMNRR